MKKVMICLIGCFLLALTTLRAQDSAKADSAGSPVDTTKQTQGGSVISRDTAVSTPRDTTIQYRDTTMQIKDTVISLADDPVSKQDTTIYASSKRDKPETSKDIAAVTPAGSGAGSSADGVGAAAAKDTATKEDKAEESTRQLDKRWFISPLLKGQFQDFALLEKNRKGYLSDANTLPFLKRGNASFAASAYKNLTQRLSISADLGLSFGHVTNDNVLISQTKSKTYNLLNAALYYHLLAPSYRLQPYVTVGINDVINDASYASVPMGIGAKFNARKVMVTGQVTYGYAMSKSISNTTMYSLGIYLPIKNKKQKQLDQEDNSPYNRKSDKKDTANKNNGSVVNNIFITINMDSVLKAKGLLDDNGNPLGGRRGDGGDDGDDDGRGGGRGARSKRARPFRSLGLDDFSDDDYKIDSLDGKPVLRFVVYFEFNEYGLTTKAFNNIDKVIGHLRKTTEFSVEIKGYTDSIGTNTYNNMLSRRRAKMVLDYMNSRGVPTELMKAKAYGSDNPVGDNGDPNQAWLNRRAEIIIHQKEFTASAATGK
jgi:outer membrane protein OmpA-like peptidoglycan-associated protein